MSKDNTVIAGEIISALHDELYRAYYLNKDFNKPFGEYVMNNNEMGFMMESIKLLPNITNRAAGISLHKFDNQSKHALGSLGFAV